MKVNKFLMLGIAGLAFAACSNEEMPTSGNDLGEVGAVAITIAKPQTRAMATSGTNPVEVVPQVGTEVEIILTASNGEQRITLTPEQWEAGQKVVFWNVETPQNVSVSMNGGVANYDAINIATGTPNLQVDPVAIPVYGFTDDFTPTDRNENPGSDGMVDSNHQAGNGSTDMLYQIYTATVNLEIPVARLEVSGIKHVDTGEEGCIFETLTIDGVYMDWVKPTNGGVRTDYQFVAGGTGTGDEAILKLAIPVNSQEDPSNSGFLPTDTKNDFMDLTAVWPSQPEGYNYEEPNPTYAYAFNFYGATDQEIDEANKVEDDLETSDVNEHIQALQNLNPKFKIYFATATGSGDAVTQPRYAMITRYKDTAGNDKVLQNGTIYRIVKAELADKNIIGDEGGNTMLGVEVTVVEATWTVETIDAEWAE